MAQRVVPSAGDRIREHQIAAAAEQRGIQGERPLELAYGAVGHVVEREQEAKPLVRQDVPGIQIDRGSGRGDRTVVLTTQLEPIAEDADDNRGERISFTRPAEESDAFVYSANAEQRRAVRPDGVG
ncbi:MAG: hypothetical protein ACRENC_10610, partial [Gemmatimonadaceae bacterium]